MNIIEWFAFKKKKRLVLVCFVPFLNCTHKEEKNLYAFMETICAIVDHSSCVENIQRHIFTSHVFFGKIKMRSRNLFKAFFQWDCLIDVDLGNENDYEQGEKWTMTVEEELIDMRLIYITSIHDSNFTVCTICDYYGMTVT